MTATLNTLCLMAMAIEISSAKWIVASRASVAGKVRQKTLTEKTAEERLAALLVEIKTARQALGVAEDARVLVAYEAGQEGFWLLWALRNAGVDAEVIDPVSLKVDRRSRRAKTDRLDADALAGALWQYLSGETGALRMVRPPEVVTEDSREWQRERDRLEGMRRGALDRIGKKLRTQGLWQQPKNWRSALRAGKLKVFAGGPLGAMLERALQRELDRVELIETQLRALEQQIESLDPANLARIAQLQQLCAIGPVSARALSMKLYWRTFRNRREVGGCTGLVGTPYDSGTSRQDQGISKQGDPRIRSLLIELSWMWLRYQPNSDITLWFQERTQGGGKRNKRVMIVAVARRLSIALWRYLKDGVCPAGAVFKSAAGAKPKPASRRQAA